MHFVQDINTIIDVMLIEELTNDVLQSYIEVMEVLKLVDYNNFDVNEDDDYLEDLL